MIQKPILMFDVDGVIGDTPHEEAWRLACQEWGIDTCGFTQFYASYVSGEPAITGSYNILSYLNNSYFKTNNITDEHEKMDIAKTFKNPVKQRYVDDLISKGKLNIYEDILNIIINAKKNGYNVMAVSASDNAKSILAKFNILDLFHTTALGINAHWNTTIEKVNHYAMAYGKLLHHINQESADVIVFEDAPKGVRAASSLGFRCIGVSRKSDGKDITTKEELISAGAKVALDEKELNQFKIEELKKIFR